MALRSFINQFGSRQQLNGNSGTLWGMYFSCHVQSISNLLTVNLVLDMDLLKWI